jgi:hypothetical protein
MKIYILLSLLSFLVFTFPHASPLPNPMKVVKSAFTMKKQICKLLSLIISSDNYILICFGILLATGMQDSGASQAASVRFSSLTNNYNSLQALTISSLLASEVTQASSSRASMLSSRSMSMSSYLYSLNYLS